MLKQRELESMPKASHGYGGRFGVQEDRMDKVNNTPLAGDSVSRVRLSISELHARRRGHMPLLI